METQDRDPETWSIDRVKQWAINAFPFGAALATSLAENDVDGWILLNYITDETLKHDIGIKSLGQRVKILEAIANLNSRGFNLREGEVDR